MNFIFTVAQWDKFCLFTFYSVFHVGKSLVYGEVNYWLFKGSDFEIPVPWDDPFRVVSVLISFGNGHCWPWFSIPEMKCVKKKKSVHFLLESCASFDLKIVGIIWKTSSHQRLLKFVLFFCFDCLNRECLSIDSYPDRPGNLEKLSWFKSFHCFLWSCLLELTFHVQKKDNAHCMQLA